MTPSDHVGMRVRMYRIQKKMTLEYFAKRIQKAPSTVSKYESGKIVLDINVIYEMASVLEVTISQLIDYPTESSPSQQKAVTGNFFQRTNLYYVYTLFAPSKTPYTCAMELSRTNEVDSFGKFTFYFDIENVNTYTNPRYLYFGDYTCFDYGTVFYLSNPYSPGDIGMIYAKAPFSVGNTTKGIFTFLPSKMRNPCSTKVLFSTTPVSLSENLLSELSISDKGTISTQKKTNLFMVD